MQRIQILSRRLTVLASLTVASLSVQSVSNAACVDENTCYGTQALSSLTSGDRNSAFGYWALPNSSVSIDNTAIGHKTLFFNDIGSHNTAIGSSALYSNTIGNENTASGYYSLLHNTEGKQNTAIGASTLHYNTIGSNNTAAGYHALRINNDGTHNTAIGSLAMEGNNTGRENTASGTFALLSNIAGNRNTANGSAALYNAMGSRNVGLGYYAGFNITSGSDNIIIGSGQKAKPADNRVIRIGSNAQKKTFIGGINGVTTGMANAVPVVIDSNGQLGTISSSRRFKADIQLMGSASDRLLDLRPVTFHYKQPFEDGSTPVQFGLIAEEVAEVFPELVVRDASGNVETVSYHLLSSLLVNELQKEHRVNESQAARIASLEAQVAELAALVEGYKH